MKKSLYDFCIENGKDSLLIEWNYEANKELTPRLISYGSGKKVWWRCKKGHEWQAVVNSRSSGSGCPVCAGRISSEGYNDLATEMPELAAQWHPEKNIPLTPSRVTKGSTHIVWWRCENGHEWRASVKSRAGGNGCPVCAGRKLLSGENDLATVCPDLAQQWHPVKNGSLRPETVLATTMRRVWWRCPKGHEWQAKVKDRMSGTGCPVCSGRKVVVGDNDLESNYLMIAAQWHPVKNGRLSPREVSAFSNKRVWWKCELGHEWQTSVYSRTGEKTGCPYCTNRKVLAGFNDLATLEPKLAEQWDPVLNGTLTPEQITAGSKRKIWWRCPLGHEWKTAVYSRTGPKRTGCPVCAGKVRRRKRKW